MNQLSIVMSVEVFEVLYATISKVKDDSDSLILVRLNGAQIDQVLEQMRGTAVTDGAVFFNIEKQYGLLFVGACDVCIGSVMAVMKHNNENITAELVLENIQLDVMGRQFDYIRNSLMEEFGYEFDDEKKLYKEKSA